MTLVESIKYFCRNTGKTIAGLERELGYARGTIARWDKHSPNVARVQEVADALGTTVDALMRGVTAQDDISGERL